MYMYVFWLLYLQVWLLPPARAFTALQRMSHDGGPCFCTSYLCCSQACSVPLRHSVGSLLPHFFSIISRSGDLSLKASPRALHFPATSITSSMTSIRSSSSTAGYEIWGCKYGTWSTDLWTYQDQGSLFFFFRPRCISTMHTLVYPFNGSNYCKILTIVFVHILWKCQNGSHQTKNTYHYQKCPVHWCEEHHWCHTPPDMFHICIVSQR